MATQGEVASKDPHLVEYEAFIEAQLRKTRSHVRGVDLATSLIALAAGTLVYFFLAAQIDHWLVTGGLGFWGRLLLLVVYLGGAGWYVATQLLPLILKKINPLYAAHTIEASRPTLKNTLVNFLLFRANPAGVHERVFEAIEEQAATHLAGVQVEGAVDRGKLIRLGYVLIGLLVLWALYTIVSPKNLFQTVGRVILPWADIGAPTQTVIDEVTPGNAQAFRGQQVTVSARVSGLPDDEKVMLFYTTADRQIVDRAVEMNLPADDYRHEAVLPAGDSSLQQTISYRIEAGDAQRGPYTLEVVAAPTIVVQAVEYEYPKYTGLVSQRVEHQGDIKAIEGTQIKLHALANHDIQAAHIDFDCDHKHDLPLVAEGTNAQGTFRLNLAADREKPEFSSYQLLFKNTQGQQNPQPVRHQIEVTRDIPPEIQFVAPKNDALSLPADAMVDLEVVANDPDFALGEVRLSARQGESLVVDETLLKETWRGQFVKKYRFDAAKLKLKPGDEVEYWAAAADNKDPHPNRVETDRRRIRVISPSGKQKPQDQLAKNDPKRGDGRPQPNQGEANEKLPPEKEPPENEPDESADEPRRPEKGEPRENEPGNKRDAQPREQPSEQKQTPGKEQQPAGEPGEVQQDQAGETGQGGEQGQGGKSGEQGQGENGSSQEGAGEERQESVPSDGSNDGDAFDRILKHRDEQESQGGRQSSGQSPDQPGGESEQPAGNGPDNPRDGEPSGAKQAGDKPSSQQQPAEKQSTKEEEKSPDDKARQQEKSADENVASEKSDGKKSEGSPAREQGEKQSGGKQSGGKQSGGEQGEPPGEPSQDKQGGKSGTSQSKSGQPGQKQPGQKQSGEKSAGEQSDERPASPHDAPAEETSKSGGKSQDQGQRQQKPAGTKDPPASQEQGQGRSGEKSDAGQQSSEQSGQKERERGEGSDSPAKPPGEKTPSGEKDPRAQSTQDNNTRENGSPQQKTPGQGAKSQDDPTRQPRQQPQPDGQQQPDAKGGDGEQQKGESGAGQKGNEQQGSPMPQEDTQPRSKSQQPGQDQQSSPREGKEQSPSNSKRESDSQGQDDGDRSGGGKQGGGQKADKPGTGGAGQNTAADEGAGQSEEAGDGETSDRPGGDKHAAGQTGQQGHQQGEGSKSQPGEGQKPGGEENASDRQQEGNNEGEAGKAGGGGLSPNATNPNGGQMPKAREWQPGQEQADAANLDYTRKATDLALEHLKDQLRKGEPDQELLDRLGWSKGDLEKFVKRWESMRADSQVPGDKGTTARKQLDDTLRSLGLRPRATTLKSSAARDDRAGGLKESRRTTPPAEYSEAFKAYTQGTGKGK